MEIKTDAAIIQDYLEDMTDEEIVDLFHCNETL